MCMTARAARRHVGVSKAAASLIERSNLSTIVDDDDDLPPRPQSLDAHTASHQRARPPRPAASVLGQLDTSLCGSVAGLKKGGSGLLVDEFVLLIDCSEDMTAFVQFDLVRGPRRPSRTLASTPTYACTSQQAALARL